MIVGYAVGMAETIALLSGGVRDGQSTTVPDEVRVLRVASEAPGLIDIYTDTGEHAHVRGNSEPGRVFAFTGQEPMTEEEGEVLRLPHTGARGH